METTNPNYSFIVPFVQALTQLGLEHVCLSPGSRSTPLAYVCNAHPGLRTWVHHDERSSAFFALGLAKSTGRPAAVLSTSGTAASEFLPAVVEARYGRVPLIVLTADRPTELRHSGAPQTIDQIRLYGDHAWFHDVGDPLPTAEGARAAAPLAIEVWRRCLEPVAGPVHLNFEFIDPLVPGDGDVPDQPTPLPDLVYAPGTAAPDDESVAPVVAELSGKRVLIICGPQPDSRLAPEVAALAGTLGAPVIADAASQLRRGPHDRSRIVTAGHSLAAAGFLDTQPPDVVIRFGGLPTSKPLQQWLTRRPEMLQVLVDPGIMADPAPGRRSILRSDPVAAAAVLAAASVGAIDETWLGTWQAAETAARHAIDTAISGLSFPNEPAVAATVGAALPDGARLWTASSMPVRDVDAYLPAAVGPLHILANRGANGIDGFLSTGFGSSLADDRPTYLLAGDLSVVHDLGALATAARVGAPAGLIVVDNDGGGIFHFLPQARFPEDFERLFGTPHGLDLVAVATSLGVAARRVTDRDDLERAVAAPPTEPTALVVPTDRHANVQHHREIQAAVGRDVAAL